MTKEQLKLEIERLTKENQELRNNTMLVSKDDVYAVEMLLDALINPTTETEEPHYFKFMFSDAKVLIRKMYDIVDSKNK